MCALFGVLDYKHSLGNEQMNLILNALATVGESRGTDASGIAYNKNGKLEIFKRPVPGHELNIQVPSGVSVVMGHDRMTTLGTEKFNYNNHPFYGNADTPFALAHNGTIYNGDLIRKDNNLPSTHIKTDSYIAVQLIENSGELSFDSLRHVAEQLDGSFTITILDGEDNLYIVKGDNPMCIYHYPKAGVYIYASTERILQTALRGLRLDLGEFEKLPISCGEIMRIDADGKRTIEEFDSSKICNDQCFYSRLFGRNAVPKSQSSVCEYMNSDELAELKTVASYLGYSDDLIGALILYGYTVEDIEEILYCA